MDQWVAVDGYLRPLPEHPTLDRHHVVIIRTFSPARGQVLDHAEQASFHKAAGLHGLPASLQTDNGAIFTGFYRHGKVLLEYELQCPPEGQTRRLLPATYFRVRSDTVDKTGKISLRYTRVRSPPLQNRGRQSPQRPASQAPHRRPRHTRDRPQRTAPTRAHARPQPHLPAPHARLSVSTMSRDICLRCPDTQQNGARGTRTPDLLGAIQALSQLSYSPLRDRRPRGRPWQGV